MFIKWYSDPTIEPPPEINIPVPFLSNTARAGDLIARVTQALGIEPCGSCAQRQAILNQIQMVPWGWR